MPKYIFLLLIILSGNAYAQTANEIELKNKEIAEAEELRSKILANNNRTFRQQYELEKINLNLSINKCDLIKAKEILDITTNTTNNLLTNLNAITEVFNETKKQRQFCFKEAAVQLEELIQFSNKAADANPDDIVFKRQQHIDLGLRDSLKIREEISINLLNSQLEDIKKTLRSNTPTTESANTQKLIQQDMEVALEDERRQLVLDESYLASIQPKLLLYVPHKLKNAQHHFSKTLLVYEQMRNAKPAFVIARMRSEFAYAISQFEELFALSENLNGLPAELAADLRRIDSQGRLLNLQLLQKQEEIRINPNIEIIDWLTDFHYEVRDLSYDTARLNGDFNKFNEALSRQ